VANLPGIAKEMKPHHHKILSLSVAIDRKTARFRMFYEFNKSLACSLFALGIVAQKCLETSVI
jgi:hypothetical protein